MNKLWILGIMALASFSSYAYLDSTNLSNTGAAIVAGASTHAKSVALGTGNARSKYQPFQEYITLRNKGKIPLNITGWMVKSDRENRTYYIGGSLHRFPAQVAYIPGGTKFITPVGLSLLSDIVLKPGEKAIITTGSMGSRIPYQIVSFKENICTGYLENMEEYDFTPALSKQCPKPKNEPGLKNLDVDCRKVVERMGSCRIPDLKSKDKDGETCRNCIDGVKVSPACYAFVKERFNYKGCIANHLSDPNFELKTWRIFLGQKWEMWAKEEETIYLFDRLNKLVTSYSY
jgi:hypothetical protein